LAIAARTLASIPAPSITDGRVAGAQESKVASIVAAQYRRIVVPALLALTPPLP